MKTPHKHAEVIRAYADGAKVQYKYQADQVWIDTENPSFLEENEYRVKSEPQKYRVALVDSEGFKPWPIIVKIRDSREIFSMHVRFIKWITEEFEVEE